MNPEQNPEQNNTTVQQPEKKPIHLAFECDRHRNIGSCTWLFSLRTMKLIRGRCIGGIKHYHLYPGKYLVITWDWWFSAVPSHLISFRIIRVDEFGERTSSGIISVGFDVLDDVLPKLPEPLQRIVQTVYKHAPEFHSCSIDLPISQEDLTWLVNKLKELRCCKEVKCFTCVCERP